jgi:hypothetical protein
MSRQRADVRCWQSRDVRTLGQLFLGR